MKAPSGTPESDSNKFMAINTDSSRSPLQYYKVLSYEGVFLPLSTQNKNEVNSTGTV